MIVTLFLLVSQTTLLPVRRGSTPATLDCNVATPDDGLQCFLLGGGAVEFSSEMSFGSLIEQEREDGRARLGGCVGTVRVAE
jgi:hypothetical protein